MTLFFYGAVELQNDEATAIDFINSLAKKLNWTIQFGAIDNSFSAADLFPIDSADSYLLFEIRHTPESDVYTQLYDGFGGESLLTHYRETGKVFGIEKWDTLEFGQNEIVTNGYRHRPAELPVVTFMSTMLKNFGDRHLLFAFDQNFDNHIECDDIIDTPDNLLMAAWATIAFGYTWPNKRMVYSP